MHCPWSITSSTASSSRRCSAATSHTEIAVCACPPASAPALLLRNVLLGRAPVYALEEWATPFDPAQVRLTASQVSLLNDDGVGRALDELFDADRASLLTAVVVRAVQEFHLDLEQLHNDSTTVTFSGDYRGATTQSLRRGKPTLAITHGHNKDHRPDLKQLLFILTIMSGVNRNVRFCSK